MIQTAFGAEYNLQPKPFYSGMTYRVDPSLAISFVQQGVAVLMDNGAPNEYLGMIEPDRDMSVETTEKRKAGRPKNDHTKKR